ncbi:hypothetical protein Mal15_37130 [Stieleria maiorica]|uniref:Sulfotransferase family protein n=1 Tax=Stieleria maiorica TaxID=2795974 RepID=A0A5B9ML65_9BACT|nr:sulfotransferase family protein [Stieleria maiorica]QEF99647.1 hypothetical protein Mal15_37130 [Stieleria maiorica]
MNKLFTLGLSHTGTRSLDRSLWLLGIRSIHWPTDKQTFKEVSSGNYRLSILEQYQSITDINTIPIYPQLDKEYPGSKFILTMRDKDAWLRSMSHVNRVDWQRYLNKSRFQVFAMTLQDELRRTGFRKALKRAWRRTRDDEAIRFIRKSTYGVLAFEDEEKLAEVYDQHHRNVLKYFENRPDDLLVINIFEGDGWEKLCPFLGKQIPDVEFPHVKSKK